MKPIYSFYVLLIFAVVLFGCAPTALPITPVKTVTQPLSPTAIPPTSTPVSTPTPIPTLRPTQTATLTPPATLSPEQAKDTIKDLLQKSIDCEAPCFWRIVPGQTTLGEVRNTFTRIGLNLEFTVAEGKRRFYGTLYEFGNGLRISPVFAIQDDIVENFEVKITLENQKVGVHREWSAYSPETLINRYGPPSKVNFFVGRGEFPSYAMDMYFGEKDLIVEYYSYDLGAKLQICPLINRMNSVWLWMGKDPQYPPHEDVPLEKATSMTMEEFSKLMTGDPKKACFNLKPEMFP